VNYTEKKAPKILFKKNKGLKEEKQMKRVSLIVLIAFAIALIPATGLAEFKPGTGEIKGYMIGEYFFILKHNTGHMDDGGQEGRHGFWFRRIYLTYNNKLSDSVKMRLRLEMNSTSNIFSSSTIVPFVKDAYISFKLGENTSLVAGIQGPPSFGNEEDIWGYRSLEKTPLDLYKWTSSRDFGISVKGGKGVLYHLMFGQGSSNKSEVNNGKKIFGSIGYEGGGLFVEGVVQYERAKTTDDDFIFKAFGAYTGDWGRVGLMYANRSYTPAGGDSRPYNIFSVFAVIKAGKKVDVIGRYDMNFGDGYKEKFDGHKISYVPFAKNHEFSFIIAALSYQVHKNVWIIPNMKFAAYRENDMLKGTEGYEKPVNDTYLNFTLFFKF
jgi:hypothetical protein